MREMWPFGLVWVLLWIGSGAMVAWAGAYAVIAILRGITGVDEYWQPPVGVAIRADPAADAQLERRGDGHVAGTRDRRSGPMTSSRRAAENERALTHSSE